ncbi:hypothetical protein F1880_007365 [Penicillium rolfsii]|nr:hypothetical protein F1880_007365 [Penicillium rolfsii]
MEKVFTFTKSSIRDCAIATTQSRPVAGRRSDGEVLQIAEEARNLRLCGRVTCAHLPQTHLVPSAAANFRAVAAPRLRLHSSCLGKVSFGVKQWEVNDQLRLLGPTTLPVNLRNELRYVHWIT